MSVKWIKYVQNDIFAIKLNNFVSIVKRTILSIPKSDGKIIKVKPIINNNFE